MADTLSTEQPDGSVHYDLAVVVSSAAMAGVSGQEVFDMVVAGGIFDMSVVVILDQDGLFHLASDQPPAGQKSLARLWQSAYLFGVERFVVRQAAMSESIQSIPRSPAMQHVACLTDAELNAVFNQSAQVVVL